MIPTSQVKALLFPIKGKASGFGHLAFLLAGSRQLISVILYGVPGC